MLNMFTFDVFSVCQSLGQSVMAISQVYILIIPQRYSCSQIFPRKNMSQKGKICDKKICLHSSQFYWQLASSNLGRILDKFWNHITLR